MACTLVLCSKYWAIFILFILILEVSTYQDQYLSNTDDEHNQNAFATIPEPKLKNKTDLGENGTWIWKNITVTTAAPTLSNNNSLIVPNVQINETSKELNSDKSFDFRVFNETSKNSNINEINADYHMYYNSTLTVNPNVAEHYWVNMENNSDVKIDDILSNAHRRAMTVNLSFEFPFYGNLVRNITISTGGFIFTGEYVHSWLAATQYVAPLMANFGTGMSNQSFVKYLDNGTAFTTMWEQVYLQDSPSDGAFTFQTTLYNNGDVVFVYKSIPVGNISDNQHPVRVGLSDAYVMDSTVLYVRRKSIYEYHRVNFNQSDIKNNTIIYLTALPTCSDSKDCHTCLANIIGNCKWCPSANRCSNGLDRQRQDWINKGCKKNTIINETQCPQLQPFDDINHNNERGSYTDKHNDDIS